MKISLNDVVRFDVEGKHLVAIFPDDNEVRIEECISPAAARSEAAKYNVALTRMKTMLRVKTNG